MLGEENWRMHMQNFASVGKQQGIVLLATLAQKWQLRLDPKHVVALRPVITLRPKYGMRMRLLRRRAC